LCGGEGGDEEEVRMFFFEKKNQKTFVLLVSAVRQTPRPNRQKSFASFLQKRRPFLL
jgi:hypothetical protein